ncbi:MAG: hypothetical protein HGA65_10920 [Oscillochloris sp.]|nr:hypothetical protein [Oscillochloris sp.]
MPYIFALLVALNLALFGPLSCAIHCLPWSQPNLPQALHSFVCPMRVDSPSLGFAAGSLTARATPQVLYEVLGLPLAILITTAMAQAAWFELCSCLPPRRLACTPPTPPPRNLL